MKIHLATIIALTVALGGAQRIIYAQTPGNPVQAVNPVTALRSSLGISYPEGPTLSVKFRGTERLPRASGEAKVERKKGMTEIEIELDEMKPATYFGGDFATYVLWTVSPEGHVDNAGEFIIEGNRSKLNVSTPLQTFGMFVTAEPHFLVAAPSTFVVLENTRPTREISGQSLKHATIEYRGFRGIYNSHRETLANVKESKGEVRSDMKQARVAVELAKRAGAAEYAPDELASAQESLEKTIGAVEAKVGDRQVMVLGHETVRLAVEAQQLAEERAFQAALDAERRAHASKIEQMHVSIEQAQSEAERNRLIAEQREMKLQIERRARQQALERAREAARQAAEEAERRELAEQRADRARQQAQLLASEKQQAELTAQRAQQEAERARQEREEARARMRQALSVVVETRETARGLIVNLPDILFDFDQASLRPEARETLSKVCGILLVAQGYQLSVEGHTDSVGTQPYNQQLSEARAANVKDYLETCGIPSDITVEGFGESQPIASNDSAENRKKNRRVEIVIEEAADFEMSRLR